VSIISADLSENSAGTLAKSCWNLSEILLESWLILCGFAGEFS
jgi:hypothetical protein